jgi:hypothetical protein
MISSLFSVLRIVVFAAFLAWIALTASRTAPARAGAAIAASAVP